MPVDVNENAIRPLQPRSGNVLLRDVSHRLSDGSEVLPDRPTNQAIDAVVWAAISMHAQIERMFEAYGEALGVSRPQAMILTILNAQSVEGGVAVNNVAAMMQVNGSFVTQQSRRLEQRGLTRRLPSNTDARVVLLALSDVGREQMRVLDARRKPACDAAFKGSDEGQFERLRSQLVAVEQRLRAASHLAPVE